MKSLVFGGAPSIRTCHARLLSQRNQVLGWFVGQHVAGMAHRMEAKAISVSLLK
jgi:hypothetical protein